MSNPSSCSSLKASQSNSHVMHCRSRPSATFQRPCPRISPSRFRRYRVQAAGRQEAGYPSSPWPRSSSTATTSTSEGSNHNGTGSRNGTTSNSGSSSLVGSNGTSHASPHHRHRGRSLAGLVGDDFRHPLDQQNTALLRALPGLELLARNIMGAAEEEVLLLENIGSSVKVGPDQLSSLHASLAEAAGVLQMDPPELYVRQHPVPNAYTLAISGRKPFIVVHTALLELLTPAEVQAVLAHELGHLKCDHGVWLTAANVLALGTVSLLPIVSRAVEEGLLRWLRAAELTCDRAALLVSQDSRVVISALMKLAGGSPSLAHELSVDAFLRQARSYDEATSSPLGWYIRNAQTRALSHPLPVMRAREIDRWSQSSQYRTLMARSGGTAP